MHHVTRRKPGKSFSSCVVVVLAANTKLANTKSFFLGKYDVRFLQTLVTFHQLINP